MTDPDEALMEWAFQTLEHALRSKVPHVRATAKRELARLIEPAVGTLKELVAGDNPAIAKQAAEALATYYAREPGEGIDA